MLCMIQLWVLVGWLWLVWDLSAELAYGFRDCLGVTFVQWFCIAFGFCVDCWDYVFASFGHAWIRLCLGGVCGVLDFVG